MHRTYFKSPDFGDQVQQGYTSLSGFDIYIEAEYRMPMQAYSTPKTCMLGSSTYK